MAWRGSISRSLLSTARSFNSSPSLSSTHRIRPPQLSAPRLQRRRLSFPNPRTIGELGCAQSLMPLAAGVRLTSHSSASIWACCELSHGTFQRSCQDR